jgi:hypothetical protein
MTMLVTKQRELDKSIERINFDNMHTLSKDNAAEVQKLLIEYVTKRQQLINKYT